MAGERINNTPRRTAWDSLSETPETSVFEKWSKGVEYMKKADDNPFGANLQEFLDEKELQAATADKTPAEAAEIRAKNREALQHNNDELSKVDEKIIEISELPQEERDALYQAEDTPDSVRAMITCIEILNMPDVDMGDEDRSTFHHILALEEAHYGLKIVTARKKLAESGARFKILTKKERESVEPGSLEDIASAALETFVMNPNYDATTQIVNYDRYLNEIMLDCTKRKIAREKGAKKIKTEVDLDEFQARVSESMSEYLLDNNSRSDERLYTQSEFASLQEKAVEFEAQKRSGHHFETDAERYNVGLQVINAKEKRVETKHLDRESRDFRERVKDKVRSANKAIFKYNKKMAKIEVRPWAEKIDLGHIEEINKDESLSYEEKCRQLLDYLQRIFEIQNKGLDGKSQPIGLKWFRYAEPGEERPDPLDEEFDDEDEEESDKDNLPVRERGIGGEWDTSEKSIYLPKQDETVKTMSPRTIGVIAHEMWHAKQSDIVDDSQRAESVQFDPKARYYSINNQAYVTPNLPDKKSRKKYYQQIVEVEAYVMKETVMERLQRQQNAKRGRKIFQALFRR